jgi:hypothetical protein
MEPSDRQREFADMPFVVGLDHDGAGQAQQRLSDRGNIEAAPGRRTQPFRPTDPELSGGPRYAPRGQRMSRSAQRA